MQITQFKMIWSKNPLHVVYKEEGMDISHRH